MPRLKYVDSQGIKLLSVTQIAKAYGDNGALIYWDNTGGERTWEELN